MTVAPEHQVSPRSIGPVEDHHLADDARAQERHYACLAVITHLRPGDARLLRTVAGLTGLLPGDSSADAHVLVCAGSQRAARRMVVSLIADAVPHAVVTVPDVVDYDSALLHYLERHSSDLDLLPADFDDCAAVTHALDRLA